MLTLFTTTKPFRGGDAINQRNAILSWLQLRPKCEIILFGNDEGATEVAKDFGLRHVPDVACNEYGTPLLNAVFDHAQAAAKHHILCYVNADIILLNDFVPAVQRIPFRRFLMVGQRWDIDLNYELDISQPEWEARLRQQLAIHAVLHPQTGIDYFVFPRDLWGEIPPFAIGRTAWDNWLIFRAREKKAAVIDATMAVTAVHQNHDWSHIPAGKQWSWEGPEAVRNRELAGGDAHFFTILDVGWLLDQQGLRRAKTPAHLQRAKATWEVLHPCLHSLYRNILYVLLLPMRAIKTIVCKGGPLLGEKGHKDKQV